MPISLMFAFVHLFLHDILFVECDCLAPRMLWFEVQDKSIEPEKGRFMEKTVSGQEIRLEVIEHDKDICQEFVIHSASFCYKSWMMWTLIFNILGFMMQLHTQVHV